MTVTYKLPSNSVQGILMTINVLSWIIFILELVILSYMYYRSKSWEPIYAFIRKDKISSLRFGKIMKRKWISLVITTSLAFITFRVLFHEPLILALDVVIIDSLEATGKISESGIRLYEARRIGDYTDFGFYFTLFVMVVPIWLQSALVWAERSNQQFSQRLKKGVYLFLTVVTILFLGALLPLFGLAFYELMRPYSSPRSSTEDEREAILFYFTAPVCSLCSIFTLTLIIVIGSKVVALIRNNDPTTIAKHASIEMKTIQSTYNNNNNNSLNEYNIDNNNNNHDKKNDIDHHNNNNAKLSENDNVNNNNNNNEKNNTTDVTQKNVKPSTKGSETKIGKSSGTQIMNESLENQLRAQRKTAIKLTIVMALLSLCVIFRILGVALIGSDLYEFIILLIYLRIPASIIFGVIIFSFWPATKLD